jgi:hypothetical protein
MAILGSRPVTKRRGGCVAHGKLDRSLTGDWSAVRRPGDGGRWWRPKACGESTL